MPHADDDTEYKYTLKRKDSSRVGTSRFLMREQNMKEFLGA